MQSADKITDDLYSNDPLLRAKDAQKYLSVGKQFFYELIKQGRLPKGIALSSHCVCWKRSWLNKFINETAANAAD